MWTDEIPEIPDRDERIKEVLTDAYGEEEELVAFETYLGDSLEFPFEATWRDPDEKGHAEKVKVLEMAGSNLRRGVLLKVQRGSKTRKLEAGQVWPVDEQSQNATVLGDYQEWFKTLDGYNEEEDEEE
jgi:hypothetical protein